VSKSRKYRPTRFLAGFRFGPWRLDKVCWTWCCLLIGTRDDRTFLNPDVADKLFGLKPDGPEPVNVPIPSLPAWFGGVTECIHVKRVVLIDGTIRLVAKCYAGASRQENNSTGKGRRGLVIWRH
jgi:hypothetical protein